MNVYLSDEQAVEVDLVELRALALHVLREQGVPAQSEVAVMLLDDDAMAVYNERFMSRPGTTDVLAFPLLALTPGTPPEWRHGDPPVALGDVLLCPAEIARRAPDHEVSPDEHLRRLLVHGLLHILGYDHETDADADAMESEERNLLRGASRA